MTKAQPRHVVLASANGHKCSNVITRRLDKSSCCVVSLIQKFALFFSSQPFPNCMCSGGTMPNPCVSRFPQCSDAPASGHTQPPAVCHAFLPCLAQLHNPPGQLALDFCEPSNPQRIFHCQVVDKSAFRPASRQMPSCPRSLCR